MIVIVEQMYLEDKVKEADSLTFKIHELEIQLSKEKEEGKRYHLKELLALMNCILIVWLSLGNLLWCLVYYNWISIAVKRNHVAVPSLW